jgi:hypothetical protein
MMTPAQRKLISRYRPGSSSDEEFVAEFGVDPRQDRDFVPSELRDAMANQMPGDLEDAMYLAFRFDLSRSWAPLLAQLLEEEWHTSHEDLAEALQDIREPSTVEALFYTAQKRLPYLAYDAAFALAVKCIWALHDIGTDAAIEKLGHLASSEAPPIRAAAKERLAALAARRPEDPVPRYRLARDAKVRPM